MFVAHCLLNQNAKVEGLAHYAGAVAPVLSQLADAGIGIVQLPCPEHEHLGPLRPVGSDTVEQYDTHQYREICSRIAEHAASKARSYQKAGYRVVCVLGVEGSPSCSVSRSPHLGGASGPHLVAGMGIFARALFDSFKSHGVEAPFLGIPESAEAGDFDAALGELRALLREEAGHP